MKAFFSLSLLAASICLGAAAESSRVDLSVTLHNALFPRDKPIADGPTLLLDVSRTGDRWERVWGFAGDFHINAPHPGRVVVGTVTDDQIALTIELDVQSGSWARGGRARYEIELKQNQAGGATGTFQGEFRGIPISGKAEAEFKPPHAVAPAGSIQPQPGEHPRLLFRKSDLPELRKKAETPFGQAALAQMGLTSKNETDVVGLGVKYQLTGERRFADEAIPGVERLMERWLHCDQYGNNVGDRVEKMALAFDLCYDAWPREFKRRVQRYLLWVADCVWHQQKKMHQGINWHLCSNWSAPIYAGVGFSGLALWGEPGDKPVKPTAPNSGARVPPVDDYQPGKGVPIVRFQNDEMPNDWLCASPLPWKKSGDPLAALGGAARARPELGTKITFTGQTEAFRRLTRETNGGYWAHPNYTRSKDALDITICSKRVNFSVSYFYCVVSNEAPRWVRVITDYNPATVYLNGIALDDNEAAHLEPGLYPVMVLAPLDWCNSWGHVAARPRFAEITEAEAKTLTDARRAEHAQAMLDWEFDVAEWQRLSGRDVPSQKLFEASRLVMRLFAENAVGTGGFQAELAHYGNIASKPALRYAAAYHQMFGDDLTPECDFECFLPRKMFAHAYGADGQTLAQDINTAPNVEPEMFAATFPLIRDDWKSAVLWGWNWHAGVMDRASAKPPTAANEKERSRQAEDNSVFGDLLSVNPVLAFVNYPLDLQAQSPQGILPLTWQAPTFGYYGFRNAWSGADDFIVQVFLKARHIGGWNAPNAGTFRVLGLGEIWAHGPTDRSRSRWEESVVWLPEDDINLGASARLISSEFKPDGSGVVTFDLADVYASAHLDERGRRQNLYERYDGVRRASAFKASGITGTRSVAVDYSGKCGTPCLLAISDRIRGGKSKVWVWQLGQAAGKKPFNDLAATRVEGNTFTITKGDGTLHGTFIAPKPVKLTAEVREQSMVGAAASVAGKVLERPVAGVFAEGGDDFFVVVTIQRGVAPEIKIDGHQATVGGRKVIFGENSILVE